MKNSKQFNVYQLVTDRIMDQLKAGKIPWQRPWDPEGDLPTNLISRKPYRGINLFLLPSEKYESQYYLTFHQCSKLGGQVRKGEKSWLVVYWNWLDIEDDKGNIINDDGDRIKRVPFLRYYRVFNLEQCDGLPESVIPVKKSNPIKPIKRCENLVKDMPLRPKIEHNGNGRAFYRQATDSVSMPRKDSFKTSEGYYETLFHELTHSTGHPSRCNRDCWKNFDGFGGYEYSKEELVAEFGAAFLCGVTGISRSTIKNSASYIQDWMSRLQSDPKLAVHAAGQAQKAADFIQGIKQSNGESGE